jgi:hypothetical protein
VPALAPLHICPEASIESVLNGLTPSAAPSADGARTAVAVGPNLIGVVFNGPTTIKTCTTPRGGTDVGR